MVYLQRLQIPAVIVDSGSSAVDVTSPRRCALRDWSADVTCHDTGRVVVIQDRDVCRAKRLSTSYQVLLVLFTTYVAAWRIFLWASVCLFVCQTVTFDILDIESSF